jgi:hypothetical protein
VIDRSVVQAKHREVELRDEEVNVVARIADQRDAFAIARKVGLLTRVVYPSNSLAGSSRQ